MSRANPLRLVVRETRADSAHTQSLTLAAPHGGVLPASAPGGHLGIVWAPDRVNFYSLTRADWEPSEYSISVKLDLEGRGGSRWLHRLEVGDSVDVLPPRSAFPPATRGRHHVLIAGGIGLTPILSHMEWHQRWGSSFEVWFVGDPDGRLVERLQRAGEDRVQVCWDREEFWRRFRPRLSAAPFGSELYTCGPEGMIAAVREAAVAAGWSENRVHSESFGQKVLGGRPFDAVLARTGSQVHVPADRSLLEAVEEAGVSVPNLCRNGVCGECVTSVIAGAVEHRDDYLTEDERESGTLIMPCVSRAAGARVELEL